MSFGLESMVHMPGTYALQRLMCRPEGLIVAGKGVRILLEDDIENGEFVMDRQPNGEAWYGKKKKICRLKFERFR